jgi:hypothetical protein
MAAGVAKASHYAVVATHHHQWNAGGGSGNVRTGLGQGGRGAEWHWVAAQNGMYFILESPGAKIVLHGLAPYFIACVGGFVGNVL